LPPRPLSAAHKSFSNPRYRY